MAKKMHAGIKVAAAVGTTGAAVAAGAVVGGAADIDPGWKRVLIALGFTGLVTTVLGIIKPTRGAAVFAGIGGTIGSLALFGQSAAGRWVARMKAKRAAEPGTMAVPGREAPALPPPTAPTIPTVIVQAPTPQREPTTMEQISPMVTGLFESFGKMAGSIWGGGTTWRDTAMASGTRYARGSGTRYGRGSGTRYARGSGQRRLANN